MRQFQMNYTREHALRAWIRKVRDFADQESVPNASLLFHVYTDSLDHERLRPVREMLFNAFPDAHYVGVSSTGNLVNGSLADTHVSVTCMAFEDPDSRIEVLQFPMAYETQRQTAAELLRAVCERPWVRAIEMLTTLGGVNMPSFCEDVSALPAGVQLFGGGAHASEIVYGDTRDVFVFSAGREPTSHSAVFVLLGGPRLAIDAVRLTGWRKLGRSFAVTSARENLLMELDHQPALDVYQRYLDIPMDKRFLRLSNVFPLFFEEGEASYLRVIATWQEDGALRLASSIDRAKSCHIAYGDPVTIMRTIREEIRKVHGFAPQAIVAFSCAARKHFWGASEVSRETLPFQALAPTSGYFTAGEFLREGRDVLMHNSTLVVIGMREGEPPAELPELPRHEENHMSQQLMVSRCLATFIEASAQDEQTAGI